MKGKKKASIKDTVNAATGSGNGTDGCEHGSGKPGTNSNVDASGSGANANTGGSSFAADQFSYDRVGSRAEVYIANVKKLANQFPTQINKIVEEASMIKSTPQGRIRVLGDGDDLFEAYVPSDEE